MKAKKIMTLIYSPAFIKNNPNTCDCLKFGDEEKEVNKIATCMFLTPQVIKDAKEWSADLVITHEPTFYNHFDNPDDTFYLTQKKKAMLTEADLSVYRYHDSMHFRDQDEVNLALIDILGLKGDFDGDLRITLDEPITAIEIAERAKEVLGLKNIRVVGNTEMKATKLMLQTGMRGGYDIFIKDDNLQLAICGELCEWDHCEPVRDAAQFGYEKALVILGHVGSEREGMKLLAKTIDGKYDGAEAKYFECGEVYTHI